MLNKVLPSYFYIGLEYQMLNLRFDT